MKRFAFAAVIAILSLAVATPVHAGYLIIRVILDGGSGSGSGGTDLGGPGLPGGRPGFPGGGSLGPPGGGSLGPPGGGSLGPPPGGTGMPGDPGGTTATGTSQHDPRRSIVVVIPIDEDLTLKKGFYPKLPTNSHTNPSWRPKVHLAYRGEKFATNLFIDNVNIQLYESLLQTPSLKKTRVHEVLELHQQWKRTDKSNSKLLLTLITSALEAGMIEESVVYADELLHYATERPDKLPAEVSAFAKAYGSMRSGIVSPASKPNDAENWRIRFRAPNLTTQLHYSLIYWDASTAEVQRRLAMLEENFKGFYLWHAARGITLPVPDAPLVAILPRTGGEVVNLARALDFRGRLQADGFYAADHDLLVISPDRLDEIGLTFARQAQQIYQGGLSRDRLLAGEGPKLHVNGENGAKRPEEVARMQTIALVDRLVEDKSTLAAISREGSRQLMYHSGLLPRFVVLPEWLEHGSASFFTRSKDSAFIADDEGKMSVSVALVSGYGGPNSRLQRYFKDLQDKKELNPDPAALLKNVLTDAYFRGLRDPKEALDPDPTKTVLAGISAGGTKGQTGPAIGGGRPPFGSGGRPPFGSGGSSQGPSPMGPPGSLGPPPMGPSSVGGAGPGGAGGDPTQSILPEEDDPNTILGKKRDRLSIKAHATAWALYYYLAKSRPHDLKKFLDALSAMPRDLPLDGDTVVGLFCKSIGIENNKAALKSFADGWLEYIRIVTPGSFDVKLVDPKPSSSGGTGLPGGLGPPPGGPGGPGGSQGPPPGGSGR